MPDVPVSFFFHLSVVLFCGGVFLLLTRANAILALLGIELMLNAANLNLVAFNRLHPERLDGQTSALFVMVVAAAEAAVALAIVLHAYRHRHSVDLDKLDELGG